MDSPETSRWGLDLVLTQTTGSPRHQALIDLSLDEYAGHLQELLIIGRFRNASKIAVLHLRDLMIAVRKKRERLIPEYFVFAASDLEALDREKELPLLVNPWCLGSFNDAAPIVFMGTEEGRPAKDLGLLALGNFAYGVSWATGGRPDVLAKLSGLPAARFQDDIYHRHPYFISGRASTWRGIAKILASASGRTYESYFDVVAGQPRLGDSVYLIDRSHQPSPSAAGGSEPTSHRVRFLWAVVSAIATTARVLVVAGHTGPSASYDWIRDERVITIVVLRDSNPARGARGG